MLQIIEDFENVHVTECIHKSIQRFIYIKLFSQNNLIKLHLQATYGSVSKIEPLHFYSLIFCPQKFFDSDKSMHCVDNIL